MKTIIEDRVVLSNGVELSIAQCGAPAGAPLILLHGYTDSRRAFEPLMAHLPAHLRVIAVTQRGHGDSDKPDAPYRIDTFVGDLADLLDRLGIRQAVVVGHSMGSLVAQRFALDHPERVRALVLIGAFPTAKGNPAVEAFWEEAVAPLQDPVPRELVREFQESCLAQPVPADFLDRVVDESLKVPVRVWRSALQALLTDDFSHDLRRIAAPTLIVWGDRDAFCGEDQQHLIAEAIRGSRLIVMADIGHAPHWEDPRRVADMLGAFVETLGAPAAPLGAG
jgi:non-heme chloroperoxidase